MNEEGFMGEFSDLYVVKTAEVGRAARSMGDSKEWPHYGCGWLEFYHLANLYNLLRGIDDPRSFLEFKDEVVSIPMSHENEDEDEDFDEMEGDLDFLVYHFPESFLPLLARMDESAQVQAASQWHTSANFIWNDKPEHTKDILSHLVRLSQMAIEQQNTLVLVSSGG
jgi:hypothetical protein